MPMLHDRAVHEAIKMRLKELRPNAERRWGQMRVDQMLWHVNTALENALGRRELQQRNIPLPKPLLKWMVINVPWRKGKTPTHPQLVAKDAYDFEKERAKTLQLVDEFVARPVHDDSWGVSGIMGQLTGTEWSRLHGKHLDYHLKQFGA
jgi:hypothetical protein